MLELLPPLPPNVYNAASALAYTLKSTQEQRRDEEEGGEYAHVALYAELLLQ